MRCGGRCGDLSGDPAAWLYDGRALVLTNRLKPTWDVLTGTPAGSTFTVYVNGVVVARSAVSGSAFTFTPPAGTVAVAVVGKDIEDGTYDPLFGDDEENNCIVVNAAQTSGMAGARESVPVTGSVIDVPLTAPLNLLSRNGGNGELELQWDPPASGYPVSYDILLAQAVGGPYVTVSLVPVTQTRAVVPNLPYGVTVFAKVRALDAVGVAGPLSAPADDATAPRGTTRLEFTGPVNDEIADGALFTAAVNGRLIGLRVAVGGTIT